MRKQELIHLHMLAVEIHGFISESETIPTNTLEEYDQNGVPPTAVHYSKTAHKESLQLLQMEFSNP
ncbi:metal-binding protein [Natrialba swarupiae]|nr:metal-binding protein [Natrialba swarupiae]